MQRIIRIDEKIDLNFADKAECFVVATELDEDFCKCFIKQAEAMDKIVLLYGENAEECCLKYGAHGVIADFAAEDVGEKMPALRQKLGKGKYVGLFTRNRKHESMIVSEAEPDFIIFRVWKEGFDKIKELTDWYNDFFLIQSAAWLMDDDIDVNMLRTDFVIVGM